LKKIKNNKRKKRITYWSKRKHYKTEIDRERESSQSIFWVQPSHQREKVEEEDEEKGRERMCVVFD
jgi:hypothetical protein